MPGLKEVAWKARALSAGIRSIDRAILIEWLAILVVAYLYSATTLLDGDRLSLSQTGEHPEGSTQSILAEIGLRRYGEIPLWNPYMLTGFPLAGDFINHFWNPVATLPVILWGGVNGMKVSIFVSFILAGLGQWVFAHVFGLRGPVRLWAALLFMVSGGLALLWRLGWYYLVVGAAWFPWSFAGFWWAIHRRDRASLALAAIPAAMVLAVSGVYYLFVLAATLAVLLAVAMGCAPRGTRRIPFRRAAAIALLAAGLVAVVVVPWINSYRYNVRDSGLEVTQTGSQPIVYALINYVVSEPQWFSATILGTKGGWNWYYIGWLPLAALAFVPLAYRERSARIPIVVLSVLTAFLLAWHANRYTFFRHVYDFFPFLYNLRFVGRLLIFAASPLIVLAGLGLRHLYDAASRWAGSRSITMSEGERDQAPVEIPLKWIAIAPLLLVLFFSVRGVYRVNKAFAFVPGKLDPQSFEVLTFLRTLDRGPFYTDIGGGIPEFSWTPAAYLLEMPVINFQYNRHLASQDEQRAPGSPFFARPKYIVARPPQPLPRGARRIQGFGYWTLWEDPEALPFAFSAPRSLLESGRALTKNDVVALPARLAGPNRVVVEGAAERDRALVALVSDYPGWKAFVDGTPAPMRSINGYLGAIMKPGAHLYTFVFQPPLHRAGALVSVATLLLACGLVAADLRARPRPATVETESIP